MTDPQICKLRLWQNRIETEVEVAGSGPPLIYLHGSWGLGPDRPFVRRLAAAHTVYAPKLPGTSRGNPDAAHTLEGWLDLMLYHGELIEKLDIAAAALVGHSFGGLVAAEFAAAAPNAVSRLVLIDPVGLWRDDYPVKNWMIMSDSVRCSALFAQPDGEAARAFFDLPGDIAKRVEAQAQFIWAQGCTGKFIWPIPDRGFKNRSHRVTAPTLIVWGKNDSIIAPVYADEFANRINGAKIALIDDAGHLPHLEQQNAVVEATLKFLG